jgi:hypothetical protein
VRRNGQAHWLVARAQGRDRNLAQEGKAHASEDPREGRRALKKQPNISIISKILKYGDKWLELAASTANTAACRQRKGNWPELEHALDV